jgi:hypothetical protein
MTIKHRDLLLDEAIRRLATIDRELVGLQRQCCSPTLSRLLRKMLREQIELVRAERHDACRDLMELIELDEMPLADMGWA